MIYTNIPYAKQYSNQAVESEMLNVADRNEIRPYHQYV